MLAETGAATVELGHSERRGAFNESDAAINQKYIAPCVMAFGL